MPSLNIPWTLEIWGKHVAMHSTGKAAFVTEFDCELGIDWEAVGDGEYEWTLDSVTVEWSTPPSRCIITKDSDPDLWPILKRGFDTDELRLSERILERIDEALSDEIYERPASYEDMSMGR